MDIQTAIRSTLDRRDLSSEDMTAVMRCIMSGEATPAQIGGFLIGLRMKGETVEEIVAAARVMRELATRVDTQEPHLVDTCGTGGDGSSTFNVSTTAAIVAAAAGAHVAKHGNKSVSSTCGSADVLEAAGVNLALNAEQVASCISDVGLGFMFAPAHHGAMKHAIGPRREMGVRTIFNVLGPLTNPAGAPNQVIGVFSKELVRQLAQVLAELGSRHVMVVHAEDGLDEISVAGPTHVAEVKDMQVSERIITPEDVGMRRSDISTITVASVDDSLAMMRRVLDNISGPARDIVALNAGAAIYVSGVCASFEDGVAKALATIENGDAKQCLDALVMHTNR